MQTSFNRKNNKTKCILYRMHNFKYKTIVNIDEFHVSTYHDTKKVINQL